VAAVLVVGLVLFRQSWVHPWTVWKTVGAAIAVPAFVLFVASRLQLGRAFTVQAKATTLVTSGIYARIRHPIYVFGALLIVGIAVFAHRLQWLLILAPLIPIQVLRVRKEEQVLEQEFGDAYRDYRKKTWF
jgi:protein-S-isoprenylcysteine O-methyltransferase Ste14